MLIVDIMMEVLGKRKVVEGDWGKGIFLNGIG